MPQIAAITLKAETRPTWHVTGLSREQLDAGLIRRDALDQLAE